MSGNIIENLRHTPFGELLVGTAYKPHPLDATVALGERFAGQTILLVAIARERSGIERAGIERVRFDRKGKPALSGQRRQIQCIGQGDLAKVLRAEKSACGAEWVVVMVTLGWQALLGHSAARTVGINDAFERHRIMRDQPDLLISGAKHEMVYAAINHPQLDRAVVFGYKRDQLCEVQAEIRKAGMNVAAMRVGVAAQLELWLSRGKEAALDRDLLLSDGLSVLLLNVHNREFVLPSVEGGGAVAMPRQASARPNNVMQDIVRFVEENKGRSVVYLGPADIGIDAKKALGENPHEIIHPEEPEVHEAAMAVLADEVSHDLNPEISEVRRALPQSWYKWIWCYGAFVIAGIVITVANCMTVATEGLKKIEADSVKQSAEKRLQKVNASFKSLDEELQEAERLRTWVLANYHVQVLVRKLIQAVPENALIEKIQGKASPGSSQIRLEFVVVANNEAQLETTRAFETVLKNNAYQVGNLNENMQLGPTSLMYRWDIIIPPAGEVRPARGVGL